jgi:hypothetical protein
VNVQTFIAALAWGLLAWTVARLFPTRVRSVIAALLVLSFSLSPYVLQWSTSVLTETLALSAIALALSCAILSVTRFTWVRAVGLVLSLAMFALVRDQGAFVAVAAGVVILVAACVAAFVRRRHRDAASAPVDPRKAHAFDRQWLLLGLSLVIVGTACGVGAYVSHRNEVNVEDDLATRVFPYPARVAWFAAHGMPEERQIDEIAAQRLATALSGPTRKALLTHRITPPPAYLTFAEPTWRALDKWVGARGERTYVEYLVTHPVWAVKAPFGPTTSVVPAILSYYNNGHPVPGWAGWIWVPDWLLAAIGGAGLGVLLWQRRMTKFAYLFCGVTLLGLATAWAAWQGDGKEVNRHMLEGNVTIRVGVLLIAELAFLGWRRTPLDRAALAAPDHRAALELEQASATEPAAPAATLGHPS